MNFFIQVEPPTVTAQEKKITCRNGKPIVYDSKEIKAARQLFISLLRPHAPKEPLTGPVLLSVSWHFKPTGRHASGDWKITRPDTDNLQKLFKDCMTAAGFWKDDAQVCAEYVFKLWSSVPGINVGVERIEDRRE